MSGFDHHDAALADGERYRYYDELRGCPIGRSERYGGFWILARFADVAEAASDWSTFSSASSVLHPVDLNRRAPQVGLEQDPPVHTAYRKLYAELLSRARVRAAEPFVRGLTRRCLAELAENGGDFVERVGVPVPIETIAHLLGLDAEPTRQLRELSEAAWAALQRPAPPAPTGHGPPLTLSRLLRNEAQQRRQEPREDFLSLVVHAEIDGEPISELGLGSFLVGAVIAGHDTTLAAATNLAYQLAIEPGLAARLRAEPGLIPRAVDESLRHRGPVQNFFRTVTRDVALGEAALTAGDKVMLCFGAANRDPAQFADAERFDIDRYTDDREAGRHLAFGWGVHRCAGEFLAEMELRVLVEELLRYELSEPGPLKTAPTAYGAFLAIESLPLSLTPLTPLPSCR